MQFSNVVFGFDTLDDWTIFHSDDGTVSNIKPSSSSLASHSSPSCPRMPEDNALGEHLTSPIEDAEDGWLNEVPQCNGYSAPLLEAETDLWETPVIEPEWKEMEDTPRSTSNQQTPVDEIESPLSTPPTTPRSRPHSAPSSPTVLRDSTNVQFTFSAPVPAEVLSTPSLPLRKKKIIPVSTEDSESESEASISSDSERPKKRRKVESAAKAAPAKKCQQKPRQALKKKKPTPQVVMADDDFDLLVPDETDLRRRYPASHLACPILVGAKGSRTPCGALLITLASAEAHFIEVHDVPRNKHKSRVPIRCPWEPCRVKMSGSVMRHVLRNHCQDIRMVCAKCRKPIRGKGDGEKEHMDKCWPGGPGSSA
ncbi:hypothetical protein CVT24_006479 [Panaeolus cyanescens]|uniref:Uncharacterized protein n=1 Tax=Panaeolus cyanescens TaxID=181874 RepID=A0A409VZ62_9AGAR|nr:hypothetical protein CVT24_006479 [Panaeolus cyanescens]